MKIKSILLGLLFLTISAFALTPQEASAANAADFNPGYIVDDYIFYNSNALNDGQIQNFLNSKNPNCDYWGTQPASDWGYGHLTHAQFTEKLRSGEIRISGVDGSQFHAPPYKCLTMYTQNTPQMEAASGLCGAMGAQSNRTAAQIINDVAKACGINPQVLIILLEKEQSLITDKWPLNRQLEKATGFACPDTAPCNPSYGGFFYQVYHAARQFKVYQAYPNNYNYRAGRTNIIKWNPNSSCGTSEVYIQNQATAALYIYTPYRPNAAALNNLYGTGDGCSSYGNRNFWRIFTDWFGSTKSPGGYEIISKYNGMGGASSWLGASTDSVRLAANGGAYQQFRNGKIYWHKNTGAWTVRNGDVEVLYAGNRFESGYLGYPKSDEVSIPGKGVYQVFEGGQVYWSAATQAQGIRSGAMFTRFAELGYENSYLGFPASGETKAKDGVYQEFQNGRLYWRPNAKAMDMKKELIPAYSAAGDATGYLGLPKQSTACGLADGGCWMQFDGGKIYWSSASGAFDVHNGDVDSKYASLGWESGALGYPTSREVATGTTCSKGTDVKQDFQGGTIFWSACTNPKVRVELAP